ncbi:hypothetical protein JYT50_00735 [bacterium AH-315-A23]|nr:hypothetical protein [bacterium AH-315-A23]
MFLPLFSTLNITHLIEIFFWMLGSFLIGLFYSGFIKKKKNDSDKIKEFEDLNIKDDISKIRATKTFDRGGREMIKNVPADIYKNGLNFNRIGIVSNQDKDNLQKIKGIEFSIEEKLNNIGVFAFEQIGNFNSKDIIKITKLIDFTPGRIERDDWVGQAYNLLNEKEK